MMIRMQSPSHITLSAQVQLNTEGMPEGEERDDKL